jgi:hypothetical protein
VRPGEDEEAAPLLLVARGGWRRHAVQLFSLEGRWHGSLRPCGEPLAHFQDVRAVAAHGRLTYVAEGRPGRVQVFRDGDFHFLFEVPTPPGGRFEPVGLAPLEDGRLIVACAGADSALLVVDAAGRLVQTLAEGGEEPGQVRDPNDVVAEIGSSGCEPRVAAIDLDAERVQVFTLAGRCYGELMDLPGRAL